MNAYHRAAQLLMELAGNLSESHRTSAGEWDDDGAQASYQELIEVANQLSQTGLLLPCQVERDALGRWCHPGFPDFDEDLGAYERWLMDQALEWCVRSMENDRPDLMEKYMEEELDNFSAWEPTPPDGDGWFLIWIEDTEEGPMATWARRTTQPLPWGDEPSALLTHRGKSFSVDASIAPIVEALNAGGVPTVASCSGHGKTVGVVSLKDGRELLIAADFEAARAMERTLSDIHGMTREERAEAFRTEQERAYRTICRERDQLAEYAATQALDLRDGGDCVCASTEAWRALPPGLQELVNHEQERLDQEREDPANG